MNLNFLRKSKAKLKKIIKNLQPVHRPDFIIIGTQKAGTTALHFYLDQHPQLTGSNPKELHYFNRDIHFGKSLSDYEHHFRGWEQNKYFESTPAYFYIPGACEAIQHAYPNIKVIVVLRDPIKRAYSAWNMYKDFFEKGKVEDVIKSKQRREGDLLYTKFYEGRDQFPSFRECIEIELDLIKTNDSFEPALLRRGLYLEQLDRYWKNFGKNNVLILGFNDLTKDTENTLKKITDFLDVEDLGWSFLNTEPRNARSYSEPISESDKQLLEDFYRQPNKELFEAIGPINW
jgi:hypothetical protein